MRADPNLADVQVCICSAISGWAVAPHANFVLHKPFAVEELMDVVDRVA
ncbi:MAG: hypothetical protein JWM53_5313 [bacterium]|nr:hypothetical protein [bacterium]